jgi:hypothetical protein
MLIAALAIWLLLIAFFVLLCRGAATADGRDLASAERHPPDSAIGDPVNAPGLVLWEEQPAPNAPARARAARGHAGRYAA